MTFEKKLMTRWVLAALAMTPMVATQAADVKAEQEAKPSKQVTVKTLEEVVVYGQANQGLSHKSTIRADQMRDMPIGNGNMTDLLVMNPNVRYSPLGDNQSGMQGGEIKPSNISINGADYDQTGFFVDNVNMNNDIGFHDGVFDGAMQTVPGLAGNQAYIFDASMLSSVEVHDRNVSASLGGFEGGAVVAKTKQYTGQDRFMVNYRTTSDKMAAMHLNDNAKRVLDQVRPLDNTPVAILQPKYTKHMANVLWEKGLTDDLGMVVGFSRRQSTIMQNRLQGFVEVPPEIPGDEPTFEPNLKKEDHTRLSDNFLLNLKWTPTVDDRFELSTRYSAYTEERYWPDNFDNNVKDTQLAFGGTLAWVHSFENGVWTNTLALDRFDNKRKSSTASNTMTNDPKKGAIWQEGGYGNSTLEQNNIHYSTEYAFDPVNWGRVEHSVSVGAILQRTHYKYDRPQDVHSRTVVIAVPELFIPGSVDEDTAEAGRVKTRYTNVAAYFEDRMQFGKWTLRPGLRIERNTFLSETNLSPRFSSQYQVTPDWSVNLGWNRYYGRNFSSVKLANEILKLNKNDKSVRQTEGLKTPNAVEFTVGTKYDYRNATIGVNYVKRSYKDVIELTQLARGKWAYVNGQGYGAEVYTIDLGNRRPVTWGPTVWNAQLAIDYTRIRRDPLGENAGQLVRYDGTLMTRAAMERKANRGVGEWIARLNLTTEVPKYDVTWTNRFSLQGPEKGYEELDMSGSPEYLPTGEELKNFYSYDNGAMLRWDMALKYEPTFLKKHSAYVQVEVNNVLDKRRKINTFKPIDNFGDLGAYTPGREFWLRVGMTW